MTMQESNQSAKCRQRPPREVPMPTPAQLAWDMLHSERARQAAEPPSHTARDQILRAAIACLSVLVAQQAVRRQVCLLCQAPPAVRCTPGGDHLRRWLDAYTLGLIGRADISNPLSARQLTERFGLTRTQERKVRQAVLAGANGHTAAPRSATT